MKGIDKRNLSMGDVDTNISRSTSSTSPVGGGSGINGKSPSAILGTSPTPSTALDQFKEYDFHTVRKRLTWSFELPDSPLRDEYQAFYQDKTSLGWLIFSCIVMLIVVLPITTFITIDTSIRLYEALNKPENTASEYEKQLLQGKLCMETIRFLFIVTGSICGIYLCYLQRLSFYDIFKDLLIRSGYQSTGLNQYANSSNQSESSTVSISLSSTLSKTPSQPSFYEGNPKKSALSPRNSGNSNRLRSQKIFPKSLSVSSGTSSREESYQLGKEGDEETAPLPTAAQPNTAATISTPPSDKLMNSSIRTIRQYYIFAYQIAFIIPLLQRTIFTPECYQYHHYDPDGDGDFIDRFTSITFQGGSHCASYATKSASFHGNLYGMGFIMLIFLAHFPDTNLKLIWFNLILILFIGIFCAIWIGAYDAIPVALIVFIASSLVIIDVSVRNIIIFLTTKKLKKLIIETERLAEQAHAIEMRHMIANVAHDLKTPLASFTTGIDLIQLSFSDIYHSIGDSDIVTMNAKLLKDSLHTIQTGINNIRNTNSFMLMSINRCIDYTKATKGMKLVPRYETIDLFETLQLPLNCMINIQNRIEIKLKEIDMSAICSHIITDKQWLQENVLCLLSNAVKYSSEGTVTISVFLETEVDKDALVPDINSINSSASLDELYDENFRRSMHIASLSHGISSALLASVSNDVALERFSNQTSEQMNLHGELELPHHGKVFLRFEIEDTGIGMTDEAMTSLFNAFKQTQRFAGGTGLGLFSLAKRMEAMNGRYGVMRRRDGQQGSLFWFSMPYRPDEAFAEIIRKDRDDVYAVSGSISRKEYKSDRKEEAKLNVMDNMVIENIESCKTVVPILSTMSSTKLVSHESVPTVPIATKPGKDNMKGGLSILLVDDSPAIVKMTGMMLKRMGHHLTVADNGAIAVKCVTEHYHANKAGFHVILMDLQMPVMDGLEATRRIREFEAELGNVVEHNILEYGNAPSPRVAISHPTIHHLIVGMSANSDIDTMNQAMEAGIDMFMPKPFNMHTFNEKVVSRFLLTNSN